MKEETRIYLLYPLQDGNTVVPCVIREIRKTPISDGGYWLDEDDDSPSMSPFEFRVKYPNERLYAVKPPYSPNAWLSAESTDAVMNMLAVVEDGSEYDWFDCDRSSATR